MKTALDFDISELDQGEENFVSQVRQYGWMSTHVMENDEGPGFTYTTGFWHRFQQPELVIFALPQDISHQILWNFFRDLESGTKLNADTPISDILEGFDVVLKPVLKEHFKGYLGQSRWFYCGDNFDAWQIVFPDGSGHFPWDEAASSEFKSFQPNIAGIEY